LPKKGHLVVTKVVRRGVWKELRQRNGSSRGFTNFYACKYRY